MIPYILVCVLCMLMYFEAFSVYCETIFQDFVRILRNSIHFCVYFGHLWRIFQHFHTRKHPEISRIARRSFENRNEFWRNRQNCYEVALSARLLPPTTLLLPCLGVPTLLDVPTSPCRLSSPYPPAALWRLWRFRRFK